MNKKFIIIIVVSILILSIGASFAYWTARIRGEGASMTFTSERVEIIFDNKDGSISSNTPIEPGWSVTRTFSIKNENETSYNYNIIIKDLINTFKTTGFLQFKITSTNGYNMTDYKDIPKSETKTDVSLLENITIGANETHDYTVEFRYIETLEDQSEDMGAVLSGKLFINEYRSTTFYNQLLADNKEIKTRDNFNDVFTETNINTLYKANGEQTIGGQDVYYFAGNAQNNWIQFGKDEDGLDLYWRIIRTNEDKGVRLLYIGPDKTTTNAFIKLNGVYMSGGSTTTGIYSEPSQTGSKLTYNYSNPGGLSPQLINSKTSSWYVNTLSRQTDSSNYTYDNYVSKTAVYCNDASRSSTSGTTTYYGAYNRLQTNKTPTYNCETSSSYIYQSVDYLTSLNYPIAQMSADEIAFAGGKVMGFMNTEQAWYYLNSENESATSSNSWWTMTPVSEDVNTNVYNVYAVSGSTIKGALMSTSVNNATTGIRPVISLKSCVTWESGNGSSSNPYKVSIDSTCSAANN